MNLLKSQEALIKEIHNEFDTAQDRLLSQAQEFLDSVNKVSVSANLESITTRLQKVGFVNTPLAKKGEAAIKKVHEKRIEGIKTKEQADLIQYYKQTYPFLKFLTEDELDRICYKYSLIHAPVGNYIEEVPEKNLRDIETAQNLKETDAAIDVTLFSGRVWCDYNFASLDALLKNQCANLKDVKFKKIEPFKDEYISEETKIAIGVLNSIGISTGGIRKHIWINGNVTNVKMDGLFIAAPKTHFNLTGLNKKTKHGFFSIFETEIKDPIVFRYVRGGIQVITKWGLEASDPALVLPINN